MIKDFPVFYQEMFQIQSRFWSASVSVTPTVMSQFFLFNKSIIDNNGVCFSNISNKGINYVVRYLKQMKN